MSYYHLTALAQWGLMERSGVDADLAFVLLVVWRARMGRELYQEALELIGRVSQPLLCSSRPTLVGLFGPLPDPSTAAGPHPSPL
jgi:hypothetical protein